MYAMNSGMLTPDPQNPPVASLILVLKNWMIVQIVLLKNFGKWNELLSVFLILLRKYYRLKMSCVFSIPPTTINLFFIFSKEDFVTILSLKQT